MVTEKKIPETFILVNTPYLDFVLNDVRQNFERILSRSLPSLDIVGLLTYVSMDAGAQTMQSGTDVLFLSEYHDVNIKNCEPSDIKGVLDGKACMSDVGEMTFAFSNTEGFTSLHELYTDTVRHLCKIKGLRRICLISDEKELDEMSDELVDIKPDNVDIVLFRMDHQQAKKSLRHELLIYPLLKAFGVRSEELR